MLTYPTADEYLPILYLTAFSASIKNGVIDIFLARLPIMYLLKDI